MSQPPVAIVTGAAKRVGRAIVLALADSGFDILFTYLKSGQEAMSLRTEIEGKGRACAVCRADLTSPPQAVAAIAAEFQRSFSRLDVLVNNASIYQPAPLQQVDIEQIRRFSAVHLESPLLLCQHFELLLRQSRGHVINMLDLLAERPWPTFLAYGATKAGLWNLTLGLARALAPEVTVNGISPGVVEWPPDYPQDQRDQYLRRVPLARQGTPQDVASAVLFFATAAPYVTGQILRLDGGRSIT